MKWRTILPLLGERVGVRASMNANSAENAEGRILPMRVLILNRVGDRRDAYPAAGRRFEFSAKTIQPLTKLLREELEKL